jgi:hypothetical protein
LSLLSADEPPSIENPGALTKGNARAKVQNRVADEVGERGDFRKVNRDLIAAVMAIKSIPDGHPGTGDAVVQIEQYRSVFPCPWVS